MSKERVTVTLPPQVVRDIDRTEPNRSKFVLTAVRRELERRRREELRRSLRRPHQDSEETAELGIREWGNQLPAEEEDLLDPDGGTPVRWIPGQGWIVEES